MQRPNLEIARKNLREQSEEKRKKVCYFQLNSLIFLFLDFIFDPILDDPTLSDADIMVGVPQTNFSMKDFVYHRHEDDENDDEDDDSGDERYRERLQRWRREQGLRERKRLNDARQKEAALQRRQRYDARTRQREALRQELAAKKRKIKRFNDRLPQ